MKIQDSIYLPLTPLNARIISSYTEKKKKKEEKKNKTYHQNSIRMQLCYAWFN